MTAGVAALEASREMQGLGGLQEAAAKLRRCVHLPLQVCFVSMDQACCGSLSQCRLSRCQWHDERINTIGT